MRKRRCSRPRNYFSRYEQRRLLGLVFMLMLVLLLMAEAAKPANWRWLWGTSTRSYSQADSRPQSPESDHFESGAGEFLPGIDAGDLGKLEDNRVFLPAESDVWYRWLSILRDANQSELEAGALDGVGFLVLNQQTPEYRGRLVTVRGTVRRAHYIKAPRNPAGIQGTWQCWLFTSDAYVSPIVVYSLEMPERFPQGMQMEQEAEFTGLVYKRWAYQAKGGLSVAPLVMAKEGRWIHPRSVVSEPPPRTSTFVLLVAVAAAVGISAAWAAYRRTGSKA